MYPKSSRTSSKLHAVAQRSMKSGRGAMIKFIAVMLSIPVASSFVAPQSHPASLSGLVRRGHAISRARMLAMASPPNTGMQHSWSPQDLTKDCPGFLPIPDDDYVKKYQRNPELWPVEFFLIAYRRIRNTTSQNRVWQLSNVCSKQMHSYTVWVSMLGYGYVWSDSY